MTDYSICAGIPTVEALHLGKPVIIQREHNTSATIRAEYALTARKCPPYCIQPMQLAEGVLRWVSWGLPTFERATGISRKSFSEAIHAKTQT